METVTFVVTPRKDGGGYEAVWDAVESQGGITVQGRTRAEAHENAVHALTSWIAYRGAALEVDLRFEEGPIQA